MRGDFTKQILQAIDNLEAVLAKAGLKLSDVVRLNYYVTHIEAFMAAAPAFGGRLHTANCKPASTLPGAPSRWRSSRRGGAGRRGSFSPR